MTNCSPLPKVTVITVVLNRIESIKSTIEDTLGQTYSNLEYIVIDGGSSDGTLEVIKSFSDRLLWISEPDNGIFDAMMKGARMASGNWLLFRNAGDYFYNNHIIADVFDNFKDNGEDIIIGGMRRFVNKYYIDEFSDYPNKNYFEAMPSPHPSTFIRRSIQLKFPFPPQYKQSADYWFFINVLKNGGTFLKLPYIISVFDARMGATVEHYDKSLKEDISIFETFGAPIQYIDEIKDKLNHLTKVNKRRKRFYWKWFYFFTRWYYGYYKGGWKRYYRFSELLD
jgi:glycosyltransferase involved in cell wall biosynthesis